MSYIKRDKDIIEIGNEFIARRFDISNNRFATKSIINKRTKNAVELIPCASSEEFAVSVLGRFGSKTQIRASMLGVDKINEFEKDGSALIEIVFKTAVLKNTEYKFRLIYVLRENDFYIEKQLCLSADGNLKTKIDFIDTESLVLGDGVTEIWSHPKMDKAFIDGAHACLGQPVYINSVFFGSEFPLNDNDIVSSVARLRYHCGKSLGELLDGSDEFKLHKSVAGSARSADYETVRADFLKYIERISQKTYLRTQYNSWYDHMLDISAENITSSFYEIEKGLTQNAVKPLDSYVVDDGWNDYKSDFWRFNSKFPNELYDCSKLSKNFSSTFGLWLGPRGGYNYNMPFAKRMERAGKGGYNRQSRDICVSDRNYLKNIAGLFEDYIERFDISYFKLDGFMLKPCKSKKHGHPVGGYKGIYTLTDAWEKWLKIFEKMREQREKEGKDLWINLTCYAVPSPWFLKWVNSIWMQNSNDIGFTDKSLSGEALNGRDFDKMLTYRDSLYYDFHKVRMYQFPNSNIYNHEPIYGNTAKISMTEDEFRKYMYMISSRGTAFWELYYSFNLFSPDAWRINADVLKFTEENFHILKNSVLIGKSADAGEIYGYSAWNGEEGIVSLRNPSDKKLGYSLKLDKSIGAHEKFCGLTRVNVIPYSAEKCERLYSYGDTLDVELDPHGIAIYKFSKPQENPPKLLRAKFVSENEIEMNFDKRIAVSHESFYADGYGFGCELLADYRSVRLGFENAPLPDSLNIEYKVKDLYSNVCEGRECVNNYPDGVITRSKEEPREIKGDFTLTINFNSGAKDAMLFSQGNDLAVSLSNGKIRFNCCQLKAVSDNSIPLGEDCSITLVRERNSMIKIYINGVLSGSAYEEKIKSPAIASAPIKQNNSVKSFIIRDKALAFDEV